MAAATPEFVEVFAGNRLLPGMGAYTACHGGNQFGHWAGHRGTLDQLVTVINHTGQRWELQLKGAYPTTNNRHMPGPGVAHGRLLHAVMQFLT